MQANKTKCKAVECSLGAQKHTFSAVLVSEKPSQAKCENVGLHYPHNSRSFSGKYKCNKKLREFN